MLRLDGRGAVDARLAQAGVGRFQQRLLLVCGGTQLADALELILIPFLPVAVGEEWPEAQGRGWQLSMTVFAGMMAGAPAWGALADRRGRRAAVCGANLFVGLFGLASSFVSDVAGLLACRALVGFGLGGASASLALYSECLPRAERQHRLIAYFLCFSIGSVLCALLAWVTLGAFDSWRLLLRLACLPGLAIALLYPVVPESPHYLVRVGRVVEAAAAIKHIASVNGRLHEVEGSGAQRDGEEAAAEEEAAFLERPETPPAQANRGREDASTTPFVVAVLCGLFAAMAVVYYALVELTLTYLGGSDGAALGDEQFLQIVVVNAGELPGLFAALYVIRRGGSREALVKMFALCGVLSATMAAERAFAGEDSQAGWLGTVLFFGARASALGFNQSLWIYSSVYFPTSRRALGVGFVTLFARVGALLSPVLGQVLFERSQSISLAFAAALCAACASAAGALLPNRG